VHTAELQAAAFFQLGLPRAPVPRARLCVKPEHERWWTRQRELMGISAGQDYAVVHPAALYPTKQWPAENFARLGGWLEATKKLPVIFARGPGESGVLGAVERAAAAPIRRLEGASLGQFAAALAGCRLFVGNDSGPAHMAAALARPLVVTFGSSSSGIWGPWPREDRLRARVVQNSYPCNPCPGDRCYQFEQPECILSIGLAQVQSAAEEVLGASWGTQAAQPSETAIVPHSS
jgi:heptosyltransferase-2/heptosyltransferase-3